MTTGWVVSWELEEDAPHRIPPGRRIYRDRDYQVSYYVPIGVCGFILAFRCWVLGIWNAAMGPWKIGRHGGELCLVHNGITFYTSESSRLVLYLRAANVIARLRIRSGLVRGRRVKFDVKVGNPYGYLFSRHAPRVRS